MQTLKHPLYTLLLAMLMCFVASVFAAPAMATPTDLERACNQGQTYLTLHPTVDNKGTKALDVFLPGYCGTAPVEPTEAALDRACTRGQTYLANHPDATSRLTKSLTYFVGTYCEPVVPPVVHELTGVVSDAACTVTLTGTNLLDFTYVSLDFDSLIETEAGFSSYLRVYPPGSEENLASTTVTQDEAGTITISNSAICGKNLITTSVLFGDNTGTAYYETVVIQA